MCPRLDGLGPAKRISICITKSTICWVDHDEDQGLSWEKAFASEPECLPPASHLLPVAATSESKRNVPTSGFHQESISFCSIIVRRNMVNCTTSVTTTKANWVPVINPRMSLAEAD